MAINEIENPKKDSANGQIKWNKIQDYEHEVGYRRVTNDVVK